MMDRQYEESDHVVEDYPDAMMSPKLRKPRPGSDTPEKWPDQRGNLKNVLEEASDFAEIPGEGAPFSEQISQHRKFNCWSK